MSPTAPQQISPEAQQQFKLEYAEMKLLLLDAQATIARQAEQIAALEARAAESFRERQRPDEPEAGAPVPAAPKPPRPMSRPMNDNIDPIVQLAK